MGFELFRFRSELITGSVNVFVHGSVALTALQIYFIDS